MLFKLCLVFLALAFAFADLAVDLWRAEELTRENGRCLIKNDFTRAIVEISDQKGKTNSNFIKSYIDLLAVGFKDIDASVIVLNRLNPDQFCNDIAINLPAFFTGIVWFNILNGDALWIDPVEHRIPYLEELVRICAKYNIKAGISTSLEDWEGVMGHLTATSSLLTQLPLWYDDFSINPNFLGYNHFGGWAAPSMKEFQINQFLCNMYISGYNYF